MCFSTSWMSSLIENCLSLSSWARRLSTIRTATLWVSGEASDETGLE